MTKTKSLYLCLLCLFIVAGCGTEDKEQVDLLILNANIIDVKSGSVTAGQMIAITGDTIRSVSSMEDREKFKAKNLMDAEDGFVMPGLWDMHVHFRGGDTLIAENKDLLPLFLAHGVTTVRDAGGDITPAVLKWREQIRNREMDGPNIYTSGPKLDGSQPVWEGSISVETREDIEAALDSLQALEVDYVKMYDGNLTKEAFYGIIEAAEERGLKTTGHMPLSADILKAADLGLDGSEHLYYILKSTSPLADSLTRINPGYGMMNDIIDTYDPDLARDAFRKMKEENVFIVPTLHIGKTLAEILDEDHSLDELLPYIGSGIQKTYQGRIEGAKRARAAGSTMREKMEQKSMEMIKPMYDAGVPLLAGSDCGPFNSYVYPGGSLHEELLRFRDAGLTPQEALITSVINGPKFFDLEEHYGSVTAGKVAHLIILDKNPLKDLEHLADIRAVVKDGKEYSRKNLGNMMDNLKKL